MAYGKAKLPTERLNLSGLTAKYKKSSAKASLLDITWENKRFILYLHNPFFKQLAATSVDKNGLSEWWQRWLPNVHIVWNYLLLAVVCDIFV